MRIDVKNDFIFSSARTFFLRKNGNKVTILSTGSDALCD